MGDLQNLEKAIGYEFHDIALLEHAVRHSSYTNEQRTNHTECNERLEFLGDSILGFVSADHLYHEHPDVMEGDLTRVRAALVCEDSLFEVAQSIHLGEYLFLGKGEEQRGGRSRRSILSDAVEAVIAAIYLDGGFKEAHDFIHRVLLDNASEIEVFKKRKDYKSLLQETVQKKKNQNLQYTLVGQSGPDHAKVFSVAVQLNGKTIGLGSGKSKKDAEQEAAKIALEGMGK